VTPPSTTSSSSLSPDATAPAVSVSWAEALPPGIGHLRRGLARRAVKFFVAQAAWAAVVVLRWPQVAKAFTFHDVDAAIAAATLALLPLLLVVWARWDLAAAVVPVSSRRGVSQWRLALDRVVRNRRATFGLWCLSGLYLVALLRPVLAPYDPNRQPREGVVHQRRAPFTRILVFAREGGQEAFASSVEVAGDDLLLRRDPRRAELDRRIPIASLGRPRDGWDLPGTEKETTIAGRRVPYREEFHLLGTDESGRDLLSRLIYGSGVSLWIGLVAMALAVTIGAIVGALAGYFGGLVDTALMRFVDMLLAFPLLLLLLLLVSIYRSSSIWLVVVVLGATGWMGVARLVRGQFLTLKQLDFTTAARALGVKPRRVMFRHLLPNASAPIIVDATLRVGSTILTEAALSFLGYGVQPPHPSWGNIVDGGRSYLAEAWWIATLPGIVIVFTVASFNLVGDALRDALDPRLRV
jgi:peptide/nickel transport system permease protein